MTAPYQLPLDLQLQPLGVSWASTGQPGGTRPTPSQNTASLIQIGWQATGLADTECGQTLRATLETETLNAPSHRIGILPNGLARMAASQNPILRVVGVQVAVASSMPWDWNKLPIGHFYPEEEPYGIYNSTAPGMATGGGQGILIDGVYVNWALGRQGTRVQVTYLAGWPHAALVTSVAAATSTLEVDDVTAWAGAVGWITDGASTETVACRSVAAAPAPAYTAALDYYPGQVASLSTGNYQCLNPNGPATHNGASAPIPGTSSAYWLANPEPAGPGTMTLAKPLLFAHEAPVLVTTLPPSLRWGVALYAKAQALQRGMATMAVPSGGSHGGGGLQPAIQQTLTDAAVEMLPFRRVW